MCLLFRLSFQITVLPKNALKLMFVDENSLTKRLRVVAAHNFDSKIPIVAMQFWKLD